MLLFSRYSSFTANDGNLRRGSREDHSFAAALVTSIRFEDLDIRDLCFSSKAENNLFTSLDRHFSFDTTNTCELSPSLAEYSEDMQSIVRTFLNVAFCSVLSWLVLSKILDRALSFYNEKRNSPVN